MKSLSVRVTGRWFIHVDDPYRGHNFLVIAYIQELSGQIDNE